MMQVSEEPSDGKLPSQDVHCELDITLAQSADDARQHVGREGCGLNPSGSGRQFPGQDGHE